MGKLLIQTSGEFRLIEYGVPYPPIFEVWQGDDLIFSSYWRSSALCKFKSLTSKGLKR